MSKEALAEFDRVRTAMLEKLRDCTYCGKICEDADHLYIHIVLRHKASKQ